MTKTKSVTYDSVWDAITDTPVEAANLRVRADLIHKIADVIEAKKWKLAEAATHCGITQPRQNDLLCGRIARFSLDSLVNIATSLGFVVSIELRNLSFDTQSAWV
ncbi:MAG: helix-turn-helix transcriptional regulator [Spongiibacteraceae bacterium]